jgi:hypothetical protein
MKKNGQKGRNEFEWSIGSLHCLLHRCAITESIWTQLSIDGYKGAHRHIRGGSEPVMGGQGSILHSIPVRPFLVLCPIIILPYVLLFQRGIDEPRQIPSDLTVDLGIGGSVKSVEDGLRGTRVAGTSHVIYHGGASSLKQGCPPVPRFGYSAP